MSLALAAIVGLVVAGAIGAAVAADKSSEIDDLNDQVTSLSASLDDVEGERDEAQAQADAITDRRNEIISDARAKAQEMVGDAEDELAGLEDKIKGAESDLSSTQAKLEEVQASLGTAQEEKNLSSFGNGTWQANVDYLPGTYSAPGGSGCYWEKLQGPSGGGIDNIIDNGGFNKNQIVSVDSPYFSTQGCGTWTRTGD